MHGLKLTPPAAPRTTTTRSAVRGACIGHHPTLALHAADSALNARYWRPPVGNELVRHRRKPRVQRPGAGAACRPSIAPSLDVFIPLTPPTPAPRPHPTPLHPPPRGPTPSPRLMLRSLPPDPHSAMCASHPAVPFCGKDPNLREGTTNQIPNLREGPMGPSRRFGI